MLLTVLKNAYDINKIAKTIIKVKKKLHKT